MALRRYLYDEPCHSEKQNSKRATPVVTLVSLRHPDPTATPLILRQREAIWRAMLLLCREQAWGFSTANGGSYVCFGQETRLLWEVNIARPLHKRKHQTLLEPKRNTKSFTKFYQVLYRTSQKHGPTISHILYLVYNDTKQPRSVCRAC